jgi:hypothetical protein
MKCGAADWWGLRIAPFILGGQGVGGWVALACPKPPLRQPLPSGRAGRRGLARSAARPFARLGGARGPWGRLRAPGRAMGGGLSLAGGAAAGRGAGAVVRPARVHTVQGRLRAAPRGGWGYAAVSLTGHNARRRRRQRRARGARAGRRRAPRVHDGLATGLGNVVAAGAGRAKTGGPLVRGIGVPGEEGAARGLCRGGLGGGPDRHLGVLSAGRRRRPPGGAARAG